MKLSRCFTYADFRTLARRKLPSPIFHYLEGGADDEWSLGNNVHAFEKYKLLPEMLRGVENIDLRTHVLGATMSLPVYLAPTGMSRLFHHDHELGVARAADEFGVMYGVSTVATASIEDIAAACPGPKLFQTYVLRDRGLTRELVARCKQAGYSALCLTVDTPVAGNRERDLVTGMAMPPKFTPASLASFALSPEWVFHALTGGGFDMVNISHQVAGTQKGGIAQYINEQFDRSLTWKDAEWLANEWGGPFAIKGIITAADAIKARDHGASAVMISNHGGRQLDHVPAPIDMVAPIREAVGGEMELIVEGGIRRGTDVIKALALGANACAFGRPYLYGLAAGGTAGVRRVLDLFRAELERDMALLGCASIDEIKPKHVRQG
ncbi:MAG: alpha-hydroxy-acid oxidizing protein [Robiginitomaculum sp.]|nr:alpha-hydroxy-acid oxidizing protein [Robiginitomaculum sp.]